MLVCYHRAAFLKGSPWRTVALHCIDPTVASALVDGTSAATWMVPGTWPLEG